MAMAFQEALFLRDGARAARGRAPPRLRRPGSHVDRHPIAVQDEIRRTAAEGGPARRSCRRRRSRSTTPTGWSSESGGIPCYPTLADGASPICPWEEPPDGARRAASARVASTCAELIPNRNAPAVVDAYVTAFRAAGHPRHGGNGAQHAPADPARAPRARRDPCRPAARAQAFWEATCVVAAHQHLRASGPAGLSSTVAGPPEPGLPGWTQSRVRWFSRARGGPHRHGVAGGRPVSRAADRCAGASPDADGGARRADRARAPLRSRTRSSRGAAAATPRRRPTGSCTSSRAASLWRR